MSGIAAAPGVSAGGLLKSLVVGDGEEFSADISELISC